MAGKSPEQLIEAHFFFCDIVGLSDPTMSTKDQIRRLSFLYEAIERCQAFKAVPQRSKLILPTGDGVAIGFLQGPHIPLELSIQLHQMIMKYNRGRVESESVFVRIGIHSGTVFVIKDMKGNSNIWGPGIIIARRVMDLGGSDHILLSEDVARMLLPLSRHYRECLHELGQHVFKHNLKKVVYSAYLNSGKRIFGSEKWPARMDPSSPVLLYPSIQVNITIKDPESMLVHYERINEIENGTEEPVRTVMHQIATDVPVTWNDLNIRVYDDTGSDLVISEVTVDKPLSKKFATTFTKPLGFGDKRRYTLEYDVQEPDRSFENLFLVKCGKFVVKLDYPGGGKVKTPTVYGVNSEDDSKERFPVQPTIRARGRNRYVAEWSVLNCSQQQSFRFEW
jgi:adenylate/guanylate cyclase family protein